MRIVWRLIMSKEEGLAEGRAEGQRLGRKNALIDILEDFGPISEELMCRLDNADEETLKRWNKLAARAESMEEFLQQI